MFNKPVLVYFAKCASGMIKIGATINPEMRRYQLQSQQPEFLLGFLVDKEFDGYQVEAALHRHFKDFQNPRNYDYFSISVHDLQGIEKIEIYGNRDKRYYGRAECKCHPIEWDSPAEKAKRDALNLERIPLIIIKPKRGIVGRPRLSSNPQLTQSL